MKLPRLLSRIPASITVFVLFFGISLLEAFRTHNWINVVFWIGIAAMFLFADGFKFRDLSHKDDDR
jgi:hypothetical protein